VQEFQKPKLKFSNVYQSDIQVIYSIWSGKTDWTHFYTRLHS